MHFIGSLTALLAVLSISQALDEDFAFDISDDLDIGGKSESSKDWGIPDSVAYVGQTFHLEIPKQVFGTNVQKYEAKVDGDKPLPKWLLFAKAGGIFMGVPTVQDVGSLRIVVRAIDDLGNQTNEFRLTIKLGEENPQKYCLAEDTTVLKLIIDREFNSIDSKQRVISISNIAKFFGLPYSAFKLEPQVKPDDLSDSSVILAGPGNLQSKHSKSASFIQVPVGCEGRLWPNTNSMVHQLKNQARDGTISEVLGLPLVGWRVKTESRFNNRDKRQIDGSGDDIFSSSGDGNDDYYYDNYYDYDPSDNDRGIDPIETPAPTTKPAPTTTKATTTPSTTTATTTIQTTPVTSETHPHRHHHGESKAEETEPTMNVLKVHELESAVTEEAIVVRDNIEKDEIEKNELETTVPTTVKPTEKVVSSVTVKLPTTVTEDVYDDYETIDDDDDDYETLTVIPPIDKHESSKESTVYNEGSTTKVQPETVEFIPDTTPFITTSSSTKATTTQEVTTSSTVTTSNTSTTVNTTTASPIVTATSTQPSATSPLSSATIITSTEEIVETTQPEELLPPATIPLSLPTEKLTSPTDSSSTTEKLTTQEDLTTLKQTTVRHISTTQVPTTRLVTDTFLEARNFPPTLQNRLKRIAVTAGKVFSFYIPKDTFSDAEDGFNLKLEFLDGEGMQISKDSWCQFNNHTREIYGLPLEDHISRWIYTIRATDKENQTVSDHLEILVQHYKARRAVNHEFSLYIQIEKKWEFPHLIDWPLKTIRALGAIYDSNLTDIIVRNVDYKSVPVVFTWTNDTLPKHLCPKNETDKIFRMITINSEGDPTHTLIRAMAPELRVKKVAYRGLGVCEAKPQTPHPPITPPSNFSPILRNPVNYINATLGELLIFRVPDDTFYDPEDTDPRNLKMSLLTAKRQPIPPDNWLQFDSKNKEFYGIPLHKKDVDRVEYHLVCKDSGGLPASDSLVVQVIQPPRRNFNVEFIMSLEVSHSTFSKSAAMQRKFVEKLMELFEDKNTSNIRIKSISEGPSERNVRPTVVSWFNTSLRVDICPRDEIKKLESVMVHSDRTLATRVQYFMDPEFPVSSIQLEHMGACKSRSVPPPQPPSIDISTDESSPESSHDEYLVTFIVPAVIIAAMLFLAGIFACILYRRRRTGKMNVEEDGRATYGNKGIPVIFQEELEEKPESGTKTPVILKDEKPPLAPPEYSKSGSLKLTDDSEPYQPPPPVTRTQDNGRQARPKPTPTYRKPPPYVPP
ncbi:Alpha-Dystroglycan N-terminal domain 2 [Popillia japonica]|uniref:Dystroglycan 1 n=1 Tax=Popillia japonica TaxID=7064 RepID=A0AAW1MEC5_POPJA